MPYINRDSGGKIIEVFASQQYEGQEFISDYIDNNAPILAQISALEAKATRGIRDAILRQDTSHLAQYDNQITQLRSQLQ